MIDDFKRTNSSAVHNIIVSNTSSRISSLLSFNWSDLEMSQRAQCGMHKCFFPSRSRSRKTKGDPSLVGEEGYLVANECTTQNTEKNKTYYEIAQDSWNRAQKFKKDYDIAFRHFLLEPPQLVSIPSADVIDQMNSIAWRTKTKPRSKDAEYYGKTTSKYCHSSNIVLQKVKVAPQPYLIPGCFFNKRKTGFMWHNGDLEIERFRLAVATKKNKKEDGWFMLTFEEEFQRLKVLLKKENQLWKDVQFLLDADGYIHHIDIDRMEIMWPNFPEKNQQANCFKMMKNNIFLAIK